MKFEDIQNPQLKKLYAERGDASSTIGYDAEDALEGSKDDAEFITNWLLSLSRLEEETAHFRHVLENMAAPEIVIVLQGGLVSEVATRGDKLTYRIIDLDVQDDNDAKYGDQKAGVVNVNVEQFTQETIKRNSPAYPKGESE